MSPEWVKTGDRKIYHDRDTLVKFVITIYGRAVQPGRKQCVYGYNSKSEAIEDSLYAR
jgi:hypothetical protein